MCNRYAYVEYCVTLHGSTYHTPVHAYNPGMWPRSRRLASRAASRPNASLQGKSLQSVVHVSVLGLNAGTSDSEMIVTDTTTYMPSLIHEPFYHTTLC